MKVTVTPSELRGETFAVPSKSAAHRLLIAAALKQGKTLIKNVGDSDDVRATARCLIGLGAGVELIGGDATVTGIEKVTKGAILDAGESGSTLRFLIPIVAVLGAESSFTGQGRLLQRPNEALCKALIQGGAEFDGKNVKGRLIGGKYHIDATVSSQYITGLLFALPLAEKDSEIVLEGEAVSKGYVDMTLDVLTRSGIRCEKTSSGFFVPGNQRYILPDTVECEGDWSSAAFMLVAGAICGSVRVKGICGDSLQGDKRIIDVLKDAGVSVTEGKDFFETKESKTCPFTVDIENIPDLAPVLATLAAYTEGESRLVHVRRLKLKESDRLAAAQEMLSSAGIVSKEEKDSLIIYGGHPKHGVFDGKNDHRMVMSEVILASACEGESVVSGGEAVKKSYPAFYEDYNKIGGKFHVDLEG